MTSSFEKIFHSRSFTFLIGEDEIPIVVHEAAVADQSPALNTMMRGGMSESLAGKAKWKDVDRLTFMRFTEFAYAGDYSVPTMIVKGNGKQPLRDQLQPVASISREEEPPGPAEEAPASPDEVLDLVVEDNGPWREWGFAAGKKEKKKSKHKHKSKTPKSFHTAFKKLSYPLLQPRCKFAGTCDPAMIEGTDENISEVLLLHASLYVLADKWGIESLRMLTLLKLHQTLGMLRLDTQKVKYIVELARYTYSDENTPDLVNGVDRLRELVCQYVAGNAEVTAEEGMFLDLVEEGGPFARDIWKVMAVLISDTKQEDRARVEPFA